jgi:hypothetical protein
VTAHILVNRNTWPLRGSGRATSSGSDARGERVRCIARVNASRRVPGCRLIVAKHSAQTARGGRRVDRRMPNHANPTAEHAVVAYAACSTGGKYTPSGKGTMRSPLR